METAVLLILFLLLILIGGLSAVIFLLLKNRPKDKEGDKPLLMLQGQLNQLREVVDSKLAQSSQAMQSQFERTTQIVKDVTEQLTRLGETNKQVVGFAQQLKSLEDILKNPKQRGILGEYYLEELLKNVFSPSQYQMQYQFKDGKVVDAVVFVKDKLIPIDSKFSLENYNRILEEKDTSRKEQLEKQFKQDLKNRIEETARYIRPEEKTLDFAFMFIPSEAIYYDLLVNKVGAIQSNTRDMLEYAVRERNVHIVSPTSFYAYLQTILQGLRAFQIEKSALEIRENVERLGRHLSSYNEYMKKLGSHLSTTCNTYNTAYKEFAKLDKDVVKITEGERRIEPLSIDKPAID